MPVLTALDCGCGFSGLEGIHHELHGLLHHQVGMVRFPACLLVVLDLFQLHLPFPSTAPWLLRVRATPLAIPSESSFFLMPMDHLGLDKSPKSLFRLFREVQFPAWGFAPAFNFFLVAALRWHCVHGPHSRVVGLSELTTVADFT